MAYACVWFLLFFWTSFPLWGSSSYCIVCVHIGSSVPPYLEDTLRQARLFNETCPIILIANEKALNEWISTVSVTKVACERLPMSKEHEEFIVWAKKDLRCRAGYWPYESERFFYLYDYMALNHAENVFHIENDVLLYFDIGEFLPLFQEFYPGIAATFESELKCIPGFVFIANENALKKLVKHFVRHAPKRWTDMQVIAHFWKCHPDEIDCFPMIMEKYLYDHVPISYQNSLLVRRLRHSKHIDEFCSIFDGAAIGVFFDGLNPALHNIPSDYMMKGLFNPSLLSYTWEEDGRGRKIPYAAYGNEKLRINNLHIASKRLKGFLSKQNSLD